MYIVEKNPKKVTKEFFGAVIFIALITTSILLAGFINGKKQEPVYKVSLTLSGWQNMVYCLKQSQAPSLTTNALIEEIGKQIDPILQQEQKVQDSINKTKVKPKQ